MWFRPERTDVRPDGADLRPERTVEVEESLFDAWAREKDQCRGRSVET